MHFNALSHKYFQKTVLLIIVCFVCAGVFVGVNAADEKVYEINSLKDLTDLRDAVNNGSLKEGIIGILKTSLDLKNEEWIPIGTFNHPFIGSFEGNGYTISNMTSNNGLFGYIDDSVIANLTMKNVSIYKGEEIDLNWTGGLVGSMTTNEGKGSTLRNCMVTGNVSNGNNIVVGGLVGKAAGNVDNCSAYCIISGESDHVGGLIGWMGYGCVSNSSAYCTLTIDGENVGGLIGDVTSVEWADCNVINCSAYCTISGESNFVGGLIGFVETEKCNVSNCFAYGEICGLEEVGGLIGLCIRANVSNCFAYGEIYGVKNVGGLIGSIYSSDSGNVCNCFASGFIVGDGNNVGGLIGDTGDKLNILNSLALNYYLNGNSNIRRVSSGGSLQTMEKNLAWNNMTINGNPVPEGGLDGTDVSSSDVWKNFTFWQSVFGADNISEDGLKMWNIITSDNESLWGLPYLTRLGKPSNESAEKIQYLNPNFPPIIYPTDMIYDDGQYANRQVLSQHKLPRITIYKDVFDITKAEGSHQSFSLGTSAPWENYYLWQNNSQPITFAESITDHFPQNSLESVDAMKNQNITFALGDENCTSISGTERNVSITVENYLQSYTNNSLDKTRTTDGWFFDTPYTVSLAVRPGPEAYHASEQNEKLWNSHVLIQNLTNNVSKQDSVAWRFATDTQNTMYNDYTDDNQSYLNSAEYLQVKSAESADGNNVNITLTGYKLGDVNRNDVVNINDISAMIKLILAAAKDNYTYEAALKAFPNTRIEHLIYADDNKKGGDGLIDVSDLLVINDWVVNGSAHFNYVGWE